MMSPRHSLRAIEALGTVLAGIVIVACAGPGPSVKGESDLLPRPGALVELNEVKNTSGQAFDMDVEAMLRGAMRTALQSEKLEWTSGSPSQRFILDLQLVEYRPGNAFQRWLVPGYGSTVLGVRGTLKDG